MNPGAPSPPLHSLADYERAAAEVIEPGFHDYFAGGAADEITMRDNLAAWRPPGRLRRREP